MPIYDAAAEVLIAPRQTISASTTLPAVACPGAHRLEACTWVIHLVSVSSGGVSTFALQAAQTTAGPWFDVAEGVVPASFPACQVPVGLSGPALRAKSSLPTVGALRIDIRQTGPATLTFSSWITKAVSGGIGIARRALDVNVNAP